MARGDWRQLGGVWTNATAMTSIGDRLYIADGGSIWRVDDTGAYVSIGDGEWRSRFLLAAVGSLIAIEPAGGMFRIDPADGTWVQLGGDWSAVIAATAGGDAVYAVERSGGLYRGEPSDGSYKQIPGDFASTTVLAAAGGALITVDAGGSMYRVTPRDGAWQQLDTTWGHTLSAVGDDQNLYAVCAERLYGVDPRTGTYAQVSGDTWNSRALTLMGGALYTLEPGGGLYRVEL